MPRAHGQPEVRANDAPGQSSCTGIHEFANEKTSIIADQSVGDKRPLTMMIHNPDHLPQLAAEARQEFQSLMAAKKAKISKPAQSVRIS